MLAEREVEPIIEKLKEAEAMVLSVIRDDSRMDCWAAANECKVHIWKAMEKAGDLAR